MRDTVALLTTALAGRYTVERELGRGGMATVYLAHDVKHGRHVAIKVLKPELAASIGTERFLREIQIAAGLHHPHILPLYDSGEIKPDAGPPILYYVMPYVEGESLRERMQKEKQLSLADALQITREVGTALAYAHSHGVVHRDIKPENIMMDTGQAVVTDFGIARAVAAAGGENLTETGMSLGTVTYMSPEQATASHDIDGRSDIYSLGCVLYEMLAGEPPHSGPNAQAILARRFTEPAPSIRSVRELVPHGVEAAITRALARSPADRFPSVTAFVDALGATGTTNASTAGYASPAPERKRRVLAYALGVGLPVLLAAVFFLGRRGSGSATAKNTTPVLVVLPFENLGSADDEYFAEGIAEELTARLAGLHGLRVIGRTSAIQYKNTTKTIPQIGQELGANYILEGTVRWEKPATGPSRVRVTPQLIRVDDQSHVWAGTFDAVLADVFEVQSNIAIQVTEKLNVTLLEPEQATLAARPTQNTEAYDYYLRGSSFAFREFSREDLLSAIQMFRAATNADSMYAEAWAGQARALLFLSWLHRGTQVLPEARAAVDRAIRLAPNSFETLEASGYYDYYGKRDYQGALEQFRKAREVKPSAAEIVAAAGFIYRRLGNWDGAVEELEAAVELDPRNVSNIFSLGETYCVLRRFDLGVSRISQAIALAPGVAAYHRMLASCQILAGDTAAAARTVGNAMRVLPPELAMGGMPMEAPTVLSRVLGAAFRDRLKTASVASFNGDTVGYYLSRMEYLSASGEEERARLVADSARRYFEGRMAARTPADMAAEQVPTEMLTAIPNAILGRNDEAVRLARIALERVPTSKDGLAGPMVVGLSVEVMMRAGQHDEALALLEKALQVPGILASGWLRVDPLFAPLRGNPRFERLAAGH